MASELLRGDNRVLCNLTGEGEVSLQWSEELLPFGKESRGDCLTHFLGDEDAG